MNMSAPFCNTHMLITTRVYNKCTFSSVLNNLLDYYLFSGLWYVLTFEVLIFKLLWKTNYKKLSL